MASLYTRLNYYDVSTQASQRPLGAIHIGSMLLIPAEEERAEVICYWLAVGSLLVYKAWLRLNSVATHLAELPDTPDPLSETFSPDADGSGKNLFSRY